MVEKPIFFRLDKDHIERLDGIREGKPRNTYCKDVIIDHLSMNVDELSTPVDITEYVRKIESLESELKQKNDLLLMCSGRVQDLQKDMGFLQLEYQKLSDRLMLPAPKPWWQFWKK